MIADLTKNLLTKASGLNWYKWGLVALLVLSYSGGLVGYGYHKASVKCGAEKAVAAEQKTKEVIKEVQVRVPVVQEREVESAKAKAEIARLKKELLNATDKRPENPSCDLSDAEFNSLRELSAKTRSP